MATTEPTTADLAAQKAKDLEAAAPERAKAAEDRTNELYVAVHLVVQTGKDGKPEDVQPGTTFTPAAIDLPFLLKHDAIRPATEQERVMHAHLEKLRSGVTDEAPADEDALG